MAMPLSPRWGYRGFEDVGSHGWRRGLLSVAAPRLIGVPLARLRVMPMARLTAMLLRA